MSDVEATLRALEARVRTLEDALAISRTVASYGPAVDTGSGEAAARLWTEDGVCEISAQHLVGHAAIAGMMESEPAQELVRAGIGHVYGPPILQIDGDRAVATCYSSVSRPVDGGFETFRVSANRWELVRTADGWRVSHRVTRLLDGTDEGRELFRRAVASDEA